MATIDPSIALGVRPVQVEQPLNQLAKVLQIRGMQQDSELGRMKMDEYRRGIEDQNALRSALSAPGADTYNVLLQRGKVKEATDYLKGKADVGKTEAETQAKKLEIAKNRVNLAGQAFGSVRANPTLENAHAVLDYLGQNGVYSPEQVAQYKQQTAANPGAIAQLADQAFRAALDAKEQLAKFETRNTGGRTDTLRIDPVSEQVGIAASVQNTATPGEVMTDQRGRATLAETTRHNQTMEGFRNTEVAAGGKAPAGYRYKPDGTMEAIPGGPADIKAGEAGAKREQQRMQSEAMAERVISKVDEALAKVGWTSAGPASVFSKVPGSPARNLQATLDTIKANLGFAELQQMREASPTGGALGAIAVQELIALQSTVASLDQAQTPGELEKSLGQVKKHYENWRNAVRQANQGGKTATAATPAASGKTMSMADVEATARASGRSVDEVKKAAQAKGYTVR